MKIFISSLISGMEPIRAAAREAIQQLGHDAVMAEQFAARVHSPQVACLEGLRQSGLVILILGADYGVKQDSGLSATHEEYRDAQGRRPVLAFVQEGVDRDPDQAKFVGEVQGWEGGLFRGGFSSPDNLRALVTRAVHEWELSNAAGPLDGQEILGRALAALPENERGNNHIGERSLVVSIACGPAQSVLRPSELEREEFAEQLMQAALFGGNKLFSPAAPTRQDIENGALIIQQGENKSSIRLDTQGGMVFKYNIDRTSFGPVVIEEDVTANISKIFRYANWLLETIDSTHRLTHVAIAVTLIGPDSVVWRTAAQQNASPNSYSLGWNNSERSPIHLTPGHRPRASLKLNTQQLIEDCVTLLRREWKRS